MTQTLYASVKPAQQAKSVPPKRYDFNLGSPTPWSVFALFSHASPTFSMIESPLAPMETAHSVIECCFAARVSKQTGLVRICKFAAAYHQFCHRSAPRLPTTGPTALIAVATWLLSLHTRGRSAPAAGRYALRVFAEALALNIPATAPAALSATRSHIVKLAKQAPCFTLHMILTIERLAADRGYPVSLRYFDACLMFMAFASFRFADTKNIRDVNFKKDTVAGSCLPKENLKEPFYWVFPQSGFISAGAWFEVIVDVRTRYRSRKGMPVNFLFAHTIEWKFDDTPCPPANYGSTLRTLRAFLKKAGSTKANHTLRSPAKRFRYFRGPVGLVARRPRDDRTVGTAFANTNGLRPFEMHYRITFTLRRCTTYTKRLGSIVRFRPAFYSPKQNGGCKIRCRGNRLFEPRLARHGR